LSSAEKEGENGVTLARKAFNRDLGGQGGNETVYFGMKGLGKAGEKKKKKGRKEYSQPAELRRASSEKVLVMAEGVNLQ